VLWQLRGLGREQLLAGLHARSDGCDLDTDLDVDPDTAYDATELAQALLDDAGVAAPTPAGQSPRAEAAISVSRVVMSAGGEEPVVRGGVQ